MSLLSWISQGQGVALTGDEERPLSFFKRVADVRLSGVMLRLLIALSVSWASLFIFSATAQSVYFSDTSTIYRMS